MTISRAAFWCCFGAALATLFSISISQTLLAVGILLLLVSRTPLNFPPIALPLSLFFAGTLLSLALSANPAAGLPQIRKLFVFLILLLMASTFHRVQEARWLAYGWIAIAVISALLGFRQFYERWHAAQASGTDFYAVYVSDRITGFMSHWMTFSGMQLVVLVLAASLMFFGHVRRPVKVALGLACVLILASIVLSLTRGVWMATAVAGVYLLWNWRRWSVAVLPAAAVLLFFAGPGIVRARITSFTRPHGELDSNQHRVVTFRTGIAMIEAHPWFGLGPEMVGKQFLQYVPDEIPRPLPRGWYGHLHNIYLQYAAERGIPTMLMMLWILGGALLAWLRAVRHMQPDDPWRWLVHGCIAALLAILVVGTVEHNLGDSEVLLMALSILTLGYLGAGRGVYWLTGESG